MIHAVHLRTWIFQKGQRTVATIDATSVVVYSSTLPTLEPQATDQATAVCVRSRNIVSTPVLSKYCTKVDQRLGFYSFLLPSPATLERCP